MQVVVGSGSDNTDTYNAGDDDDNWPGLGTKSGSDRRFRCTCISFTQAHHSLSVS